MNIIALFLNSVVVFHNFQLSHYLDIVEVQIARQISMRSNAFFSAMASHDKLQEDLVATTKAVQELR